MASILYLRLDSQNDTVWVSQFSLADLEAVTQAILTAIKLFEGEWWENLNLGTPMFQSIIGSNGSPQNQQVMALLIQQQIEAVPYVSSVQDSQVVFNRTSRSFTYKAVAQTSFGSVAVSQPLGNSAGLGGAE
jgi:hypothetical protein